MAAKIHDPIYQADKNFQLGRTKIFNAITENFCPRIKIFGGTIFFLTGQPEHPVMT